MIVSNGLALALVNKYSNGPALAFVHNDRTSVLGPCLDRHFRIAMAIAQGLEGHQRERERERDSLIVAGELDTEGSL